MSFYDGFIFDYKKGTPNDPISEKTETAIVLHGRIILQEIPDMDERFSYVERKSDGEEFVEIFEGAPKGKQFKCNYRMGHLIFDPEEAEGEEFEIKYFGRGVFYIHWSRVIIDDIGDESFDPEDVTELDKALKQRLEEIDDELNNASITRQEFNEVKNSLDTFTDGIDEEEEKLLDKVNAWQSEIKNIALYGSEEEEIDEGVKDLLEEIQSYISDIQSELSKIQSKRQDIGTLVEDFEEHEQAIKERLQKLANETVPEFLEELQEDFNAQATYYFRLINKAVHDAEEMLDRLRLQIAEIGNFYHRGEWKEGEDYFPYNVVEYNESSYMAKVRNMDIPPIGKISSIDRWEPIHEYLNREVRPQLEQYDYDFHWTTSTYSGFNIGNHYGPGDIVKYQLSAEESELYICLDETIGDVPPPDSEYWFKLDGINWHGLYDDEKEYVKYDAVIEPNNSNLYVCTYLTKGLKPHGVEGSTYHWKLIAEGHGHYGEYDPEKEYLPTNIVDYNGSSFVCTRFQMRDGEFQPVKGIPPKGHNKEDSRECSSYFWQYVVRSYNYVGEYDSSGKETEYEYDEYGNPIEHGYEQYDLVKFANSIYLCDIDQDERTLQRPTNEHGEAKSKWKLYLRGFGEFDDYDEYTGYLTGDIVHYEGSTFIAIKDNVDLPTVPPKGQGNSRSSDYWDYVAVGYNHRLRFTELNEYKQYDVVEFSDSTYLCVIDQDSTTNKRPVDEYGIVKSDYWQLIADGRRFYHEYDDSEHYYPGNIVTYNNSTFICLRDTEGIPPKGDGNSSTHWAYLTVGYNYRGFFALEEGDPHYEQYDVVVYYTSTFVCLIGQNETIYEYPFDKDFNLSENWGILAKGLHWAGEWDEYTEYNAGDVVEHDGSMYISIQNQNEGNQPQFEESTEYWAFAVRKGYGLEFDWNITEENIKLGVRRQDEEEYEYTPLGLNFDWRIDEYSDSAELGVKRGVDEEYEYMPLGLMYDWHITDEVIELGIKTPFEEDYEYIGIGLDFQWDGTELSIKRDIDSWDAALSQDLAGIIWKGEWQDGEVYHNREAVYRNGESFISLEDNNTSTPTRDAENWHLVARRGEDGEGTVKTIKEGDGILVDESDPANPEVNVRVKPDSGLYFDEDDRLSVDHEEVSIIEYEEGTWEPVVEPDGDNHTYSIQKGDFVIVNELVYIWVEVKILANDYGANFSEEEVAIKGLPFPFAQDTQLQATYQLGSSETMDFNFMTPMIDAEDNKIRFKFYDEEEKAMKTVNADDIDNEDADLYISFSGVYKTE